MKSTNDTSLIQTYLDYCKYNKRLDEKTVKAYAIDLRHFYMAFPDQPLISRTPQAIEAYISSLHALFKPRTVKRKIASHILFRSGLRIVSTHADIALRIFCDHAVWQYSDLPRISEIYRAAQSQPAEQPDYLRSITSTELLSKDTHYG